MKISNLFHWLYCAVMMLPLFVLPIFALAVRSDNNFTPIEIQKENVEVVDFNQVVLNGNFSVNNLGEFTNPTRRLDYLINDDELSIYPSLTATNDNYLNLDYSSYVSLNDKIIVSFDCKAYSSNIAVGMIYLGRTSPSTYYHTFISTSNLYSHYEFIFDVLDINVLYFRLSNNQTDTSLINSYKNVQIFNLSKMFGVGNEPSLEQFNIWYPNDYYAYDSGTKQLLHTGIYDTLNDTDFGSQTIYTLYKEVDTYFNYDNVFNLGDLYTWLNTNFFSGQAPLGFFIFWHLLIYWLLTSILWLIFDVLMYVPSFIHKWLDKAAVM